MDKALKQRLVGASVLIALAVIVLPMLLGGRPDGNSPEPRKIELPQQPPELSFETRRYPIGETAENSQRQEPAVDGGQPTQLPAPRIPATTDLSNVQEDSEKIADPTISGVDVPDGVAGDAESEGSDTTVPSADQHTLESLPVAGTEPDSATTSPGRYIVQVASFGGLDNANRFSARLKESGYTVMTDSVKSEVGTLHRVRVGPFSTETEAREVVNALDSSIKGVKPRVMDLQPGQTAQVTTPADPLVRWVVQVGSFSNAANAENLVASLRLQGMSAYQETIGSSGSEIYRVRIGPFLVREEAIRTERDVNEKMPVSAVVMSAD